MERTSATAARKEYSYIIGVMLGLPVEDFFLGSTVFFLAPKPKPVEVLPWAKFARSSVPGNNQMLNN